jgi:hypothetical protein
MLQFTEQLPRKWASGREGCMGHCITGFAQPDGSSRAQGIHAEPLKPVVTRDATRCAHRRQLFRVRWHTVGNVSPGGWDPRG